MSSIASAFAEDYLTYFVIYKNVKTATQRCRDTYKSHIKKLISSNTQINFIDDSHVQWLGGIWISSDDIYVNDDG